MTRAWSRWLMLRRWCGAGAIPLALVGAGTPASAQSMPSDSHIQSVPYDAGRIVPLRIAPGFVATIIFAADERIENVAVGNPGGWQVTANKQGDHLFVRALQDGGMTNLEVVTDARHYSFLLSTSYAGDPTSVFSLRFDYGAGTPASGPVAPLAAAPPSAVPSPATAASPVTVPVPSPVPGVYRVSGARLVRPISIADDGGTTRICWPARAVIPAVFARDASGDERLVNARIEHGCSVVDALWPEYRFVVGSATATARRRTPRAPRS